MYICLYACRFICKKNTRKRVTFVLLDKQRNTFGCATQCHVGVYGKTGDDGLMYSQDPCASACQIMCNRLCDANRGHW